VLIYGGAAGAGKSWFLTFTAARWHNLPGYNAVIFRRETTDIRGGGGIWDESWELYPGLGGVPREQFLEWRFRSGARIEFRHMQHESDRFAHQSKQYAFIGFDELTHFTAAQFWYLFSRARTTCGVKPSIRGTCNPDPDSFVAGLIAWWIDQDTGLPIPERSGVIRWFVRDPDTDELVWADTREELLDAAERTEAEPTSLTFIAGKLEDNPALTDKDPGYASRLAAMPKVDRERLRHGNWKIRPAAGLYFQRGYFTFVDAAPAEVAGRVRAWDKAGTKKPTKADEKSGPAFTAGVKMSRTADGVVYIEDVVRFRGTPLVNEQTIRATAELDGIAVSVGIWQDPGQAGVTDVDHYVREVLTGFAVRGIPAREDKETYAKPVSAQAEAGNVRIVRGPWNEAFIRELENVPDGRFKDQVDATSLAHLMLTGPKEPEFAFV
jgi:predicted phage terminase large subunit-like protein